MSPSNSSFTRGAQLFLHRLRMLSQGLKAALGFACLFSLIWGVIRVFTIASPESLYYWLIEFYGGVKKDVLTLFKFDVPLTVSFYSFLEKKWLTFYVSDYQQLFWKKSYGAEINALCHWVQNNCLIEMLRVFVGSIFIVSFIFFYRGQTSVLQKKLRGGALVTPDVLRRQLKRAKKASKIKFGKIPLVKHSERQHILLSGATGTGKTNLLHELIPQIRKRGERAIIVDVNGSFKDVYMREEDVLLNPFDAQSEAWLPWADAKTSFEYDAIAEALGGDYNKYDPFWDESAKKIIATTLEKFASHPSISEMLNVLNSANASKYDAFFKETHVSALTAKEGEKTVASIRANISNKVKALGYLKETENPFSISRFLNDEGKDGWLFLTSTPKMRAALRPLISVWMEVALMALMDRKPSHKGPNLWFILDELPAMGKIPSLKTALAESRKYGGCMVAGLQNMHQLFSIYGREEGHNILDNFSTKFIFRVGDQETALQASQMLGEEETIEKQESLSYGANTMRDGVSLNTIERRRSLVLPTEIMTLPDLTCFVKLAGAWPISKLSFKVHKQ